MKKLMYLLALPVVLMLTACGPDNPLIGKWEANGPMGTKSVVEFSRGAFTRTDKDMLGTESTSEIKVSEYKIEKDKVGVVIEQDGQKATVYYHLADADNVALDLGHGQRIRYQRMK